MLNGRNLVVDTLSEVYDMLKPWVDVEFWDLRNHELIPNSIYVVGRQQCTDNPLKIRAMAESNEYITIFSNPHEGSETLSWHIKMLNLHDLVMQKKLLLIGGGDMEEHYPYIKFDSFIAKTLDYEENVRAQQHIDEIFDKTDKPYKFLFLNGRGRPHRKYLIEQFRESGLLAQSLWTSLDSNGFQSRMLSLVKNGVNLMARPGNIQYLPKEYEVSYYQDTVGTELPSDQSYAKHLLFKDTWGDIYLTPAPYIDTYFSLVTETVFHYPYSFFTEKICKPLAIGHPWIAVANKGFYRDLHNMGFRTFGHVIDESFDNIDSNQDRIERINDIVHDLCNQNLASFLAACHEVCKYNQQHFTELSPKLRKEFPEHFREFLLPYTQ